MAEHPLEFCPKCDKPLIYLEVERKKDEVEVEAICLEGHKKSFDRPIVRKPIWLKFMVKRILSCVKCGNPVIPDRKTVKKGKDKFKVRCRAGCKDKYERKIEKELADAVRRLIQSRRMGVKPFPKPGAKPFKPMGARFPRRKPCGLPQKPMFKFTVPEECPKCNAPLKKEEIEQLRNNEIIECKYCGSAIQAKEEKN